MFFFITNEILQLTFNLHGECVAGVSVADREKFFLGGCE